MLFRSQRHRRQSTTLHTAKNFSGRRRSITRTRQGIVDTVRGSGMTEMFCWDAGSRQNFWRQFLSGIFIVIVMTGLDQDMMQKNLTCRSLREAPNPRRPARGKDFLKKIGPTGCNLSPIPLLWEVANKEKGR